MNIKCEDCKHHYIYSKKKKPGVGKYQTEIVKVSRCRKGHRILIGGLPGCGEKDFKPIEK